MRDKLQISSFLIFTLLLIGSVINNLYLRAAIIGWQEIILLVLILFVAVGDRFTKVVISPKEISIEQMVKELEKDMRKIDNYVKEETAPDKISEVVEDTFEHPRDIWSRLLLVRITLRRLLRRVAETHGLDYSPTASITTMLDDLCEQGIIDEALAQQVERMRDATFTVEWGAGNPPEQEDVRFTLNKYGEVFRACLKTRSEGLSRRWLAAVPAPNPRV